MSGASHGTTIFHLWRLCCVLVLAICAFIVSPSPAQVKIEASAVGHSDACVLPYNNPGLKNVYIRLTFNSGATAARFRVEPGPGVTMTYASESSPYTSVGYALAGISICFGSCLTGEPLIATVTFMAYGTDTPCSEIRIVPHPDAQTVEVEKCNGSTVAAYAQGLGIDPPPGAIPCYCPTTRLFPGTPLPFGCTVPVEDTTWGRVKALYRN